MLERSRTLQTLFAAALLAAFSGCHVRRDEPLRDAAADAAEPVDDAGDAEAGDAGDADADAGNAEPEELPNAPEGSVVVAFGGIDAPVEQSSAVLSAVRIAVAALAEGQTPIDASARGAAALEDAPALNAGIGSSARVDGSSVQMDAAVMDDRERFGAVGAIERVRNPVLVARAMIDTPHRLFVGEGAIAFARTLGFEDFDPLTSDALDRHLAALLAAAPIDAGARDASPDAAASPSDAGAPDAAGDAASPIPVIPDAGGSDTVAVLVRGADGHFAAAISSGGPELSPRGRVGDVIVPGAGVFVGAKGAVATTGQGDALFTRQLARAVYDRMVLTRSPRVAVTWAIGQLPEGTKVGIAAIDKQRAYVGSSSPMAWAEATASGEQTAEGKVTP